MIFFFVGQITFGRYVFTFLLTVQLFLFLLDFLNDFTFASKKFSLRGEGMDFFEIFQDIFFSNFRSR